MYAGDMPGIRKKKPPMSWNLIRPTRPKVVSIIWCGAVLCGLLAAGCGSAVGTDRSYTETAATVRAAEAIGAEDTPQAALHLKMARDGLSEAERLMNDDEHDQAMLVLDRAEADADLALALAQEAEAEAEAQEALDKVEKLRQQRPDR